MPARYVRCAARLWSRSGTICGGRLSNCNASRRCDRHLIERERSARCKASWQPPSENVGGFVLRRAIGNRRGDSTRSQLYRCLGRLALLQPSHETIMGDFGRRDVDICFFHYTRLHHSIATDIALLEQPVGNFMPIPQRMF